MTAEMTTRAGGDLATSDAEWSVEQIVAQTLSLKLPVVSALRDFAEEGGLLAYGVNLPALFRQASGYVDRILRGEKPADMPPVSHLSNFRSPPNLAIARPTGKVGFEGNSGRRCRRCLEAAVRRIRTFKVADRGRSDLRQGDPGSPP